MNQIEALLVAVDEQNMAKLYTHNRAVRRVEEDVFLLFSAFFSFLLSQGGRPISC